MDICNISPELIQQTIKFHGHICPGLAIGIRAAELVLKELAHNNDNPLFAVVETDMCGVDAIQFLTGCTYGKGNLVSFDYGKMAFSFYRRNDNSSIRIVINPDFLKQIQNENTMNPSKTQKEKFDYVMKSDIKNIFNTMLPKRPIPRPAQALNSMICQTCKESVMESRVRLYQGKTLCIPCFMAVEQKI